MRLRLRVDPVACDGFGHCAEMMPEHISLDEWGYPVLSGDLPPEHVAWAGEVVRACPRNALALEAHDVGTPHGRQNSHAANPEPVAASR